MSRKVSFIFISLALVLMQAVEFIPHHHHDGIVICLDADSEEGDEDDDTFCVTKASYLLNETHHDFDLQAFIPVLELEVPAEIQLVQVCHLPLDHPVFYESYRPGPSGLRAPPVYVL